MISAVGHPSRHPLGASPFGPPGDKVQRPREEWLIAMTHRYLTVADFLTAFDEIEAVARRHITTDGFTQEILIAFAANAKINITTNFTHVPMARQAERMQAWLRQAHAVAAISVCEGYLAWRSDDPVVMALPPAKRPDREEVLIVEASWPQRDVEEIRIASIIRPAMGPPDLVDLDLASEADEPAPSIKQRPRLTPRSWLSELLPR